LKRRPVEIRIDTESNSAFVRYSASEDVDVEETVDLDPTGSVAVDVDAAGAVLGIEILDAADPESLAIAARYASEHGLAFPRDLTGALVA
jgi:uncharacterized protein YuzE